jgi:adenylylsulfate kinase
VPPAATAALVLAFTRRWPLAVGLGTLQALAGRVADRLGRDNGAGRPSAAAPAIGPAVVWLTGLSGSGKSTIARAVVRRLLAQGRAVEHLDGDAIREVFPATGFGRADRDAHVKRVGYLASRLERHGVVVVASLVSPYRESRDFVRGLCRNFVEVHVSTPIEECERRDVKGLYRKARAGLVRSFTGVDDPYEPPLAPELVLDTRTVSVDEGCEAVLERLARYPAGRRAR